MQKFIITILSLYYCICINATSFTVSNVDNEEVPKDHVPIVVKKKSLNSNLHRSSTLYIEAMADNDNKEYCQLLKEKLNVIFSCPEELVKSIEKESSLRFEFGKTLDEFPTIPIFYGGFIVELSQDCSVVMMDIKNVEKPRAESYPKEREYETPEARGWMLNNCETPWAGWYINNFRGVRDDKSTNEQKEFDWVKPLPEDKLLALQEKVTQLTELYVVMHKNTGLTRKSNCDVVSVVRIPNLETVVCDSKNIDSELKANATECYGVEFYKHSSYETLKMLFLINGNNTTIDECVAKMAEYIRFE